MDLSPITGTTKVQARTVRLVLRLTGRTRPGDIAGSTATRPRLAAGWRPRAPGRSCTSQHRALAEAVGRAGLRFCEPGRPRRTPPTSSPSTPCAFDASVYCSHRTGHSWLCTAGITTHPVGQWVAHQPRNPSFMLAERTRPTARFLIPDRGAKFTGRFDEVFFSEGMRIIRTPVRAPRANAKSPSASSAPSLGSAPHPHVPVHTQWSHPHSPWQPR
jgi:hypothetical protein